MDTDRAPRPTIEVLGVYSPKANAELYDKFVAQYVSEQDPANFDKKTIEVLSRLGRRNLQPFSPEEIDEAMEEIKSHLGGAAYIEVLVRNRDEAFDFSDFRQPDAGLTHGHSQVAWNETYLSEDGESVIAGYPLPTIPEKRTLRIAFVIHSWKHELPLESSYGPLKLPPLEPMPERLWRLAPYEPPS